MHRAHRCEYIVGIDEVGRGPLAGDAYAGAVIVSAAQSRRLARAYKTSARASAAGGFPCRLADSKKLSPRQREAWFAWVRRRGIAYEVARVSPAIIDRINIARACDLAAKRAYRRIRARGNAPGALCVVADGSLAIGDSLRAGDTFKHFPKADERIPVVSLASIVAKVLRDRAMVRLSRRYPEYGFAENKGYGTQKHLRALRTHGVASVHRKSFLGGVCVRERAGTV